MADYSAARWDREAPVATSTAAYRKIEIKGDRLELAVLRQSSLNAIALIVDYRRSTRSRLRPDLKPVIPCDRQRPVTWLADLPQNGTAE